MTNKIEFHFDGDIATDHKVSIRTLAKTLGPLQVALDRAYLDETYGGVYKYARMPQSAFDEMEFLIGQARDGGFILDFLNSNSAGEVALRRLRRALEPAFERARLHGENNATHINQLIDDRVSQLANGVLEPIPYEQMLENPSPEIERNFGDRSINKEVGSILTLITSNNAGESTFELSIIDDQDSITFSFDRGMATAFKSVIKDRSLGEPVIYKALVVKLDSDNYIGKIKNLESGKKCTVRFKDVNAFREAREFLGEEEVVEFIGCPVIEDGSYDPKAGDIYFIKTL